MPQATAYSPSHITGFFEILDTQPTALERGSRGAGVSLVSGAKTSVSVGKSTRKRVSIKINGRPSPDAQVSRSVANSYLEIAGTPNEVMIEHSFEVPIGTGFGTSGAGALSLSLALNEALNTGLSSVEACQIAHQAEVANRTGLGTVIAETYGGVEVRIRPGAPGFGRILKIPHNDDYQIVAATFGPISTTHVLSTPWMRAKINGHAQELLWSLLDKPSLSLFMQLSRKFSDGINLSTPHVRQILAALDREEYETSMLMMGDGIFTVINEEDAKRAVGILSKTLPSSAFIMRSAIAKDGAKLLDT